MKLNKKERKKERKSETNRGRKGEREKQEEKEEEKVEIEYMEGIKGRQRGMHNRCKKETDRKRDRECRKERN
jgi:hypothetical protein